MNDEEWLDNLHQRVITPVMRCAATRNPGTWPYVSRCVRDANHTNDHIDRHGILWTNEGDERE